MDAVLLELILVPMKVPKTPNVPSPLHVSASPAKGSKGSACKIGGWMSWLSSDSAQQAPQKNIDIEEGAA